MAFRVALTCFSLLLIAELGRLSRQLPVNTNFCRMDSRKIIPRYKRRLDTRKNQILTHVDIVSVSFYTLELAEEAERAICEAVYNQESPLARCMGREIEFDRVPFASKGMDGRLHIQGEADPLFITCLSCHPNAKIQGSTVHLKCEPCDLLAALHDAFLAYLAAFRSCSNTRYRLRSDKRFKQLVDPKTGVVYDRDKDKYIPEGTILLLNL